ncbi:sigma-70 family RNA polymerase sigma factor [Frondihabitans cladoniiphilus]|uniref:Sigma-70 family RNA polymerase sigma factor n=1 Tax=Frondihabitans cladoniiphilus TaxID=715785 RepID=A0ABP8W647_9MICO
MTEVDPPDHAGNTDKNTLLTRIARGDAAAFDALYRRTHQATFHVIRRVLIDASQAEEVTQEVYLDIWQSAARFDPALGHARSWIHLLARRRAIDRVRTSQTDRNRNHLIGIRDHPIPFDHVSETVEILLEHERVQSAMKQLTPKQRQAIELVHDAGLSSTAIANQLGVNAGAIKTRLRDGLINLRHELNTVS